MKGPASSVYGRRNTPEQILERLREGRVRVVDFRPAKYGELFLEPHPMHGIKEWSLDWTDSSMPLLILERV